MPRISLTKAILMSAASAFTALLFAPKTGNQFRKELKSGASKLKDSSGDKAQKLLEDFRESYSEVDQELQAEQAEMDAKQAQLNKTIEEIERDLAQKQASQRDSVIDPATASHSMYDDETLGDVNGTPLDPNQDQAIPKDKVDEALHDNYLSKDNEFKLNKKDLADEKEASLKVNPHD
ncbi:YtxH-like protein [Marinilactibacillus piezotolerans]|uniref:YtxH-like protein n=1 Tax=Marinilactibacillus piezotolerans TaxID=258723 RepID=A0A1I3XMI6_9LACT|nr:YtxH domain-containing protein [Marinilactibacillus piezotolerans]SFK20743.1 YtxH-like protein [Marinilactibacillus piezotolerans]